MFQMSRLADYGMVILIHAARGKHDGIHTARNVAEDTGLPFPTVTKLLKMLERGGVLCSHRGPQGGYRLARPSEEISVVDIIKAVDGTPGLTQCNLHPVATCEREATCSAKDSWRLVSQTMTRALTGLTLADMAGQLSETGVEQRIAESISNRHAV